VVVLYEYNWNVKVFPDAVGDCGAITHADVPPGLMPSAFGWLLGIVPLTWLAVTGFVPVIDPTETALRMPVLPLPRWTW
jgi:hypothetical protein